MRPRLDIDHGALRTQKHARAETPEPRTTLASEVLRLQRTIGNAAVARMLSSESTSAVAAAGARSTGEFLPHRDAIQSAFGAHDVSTIRAHVGPEAHAATAALGASAYATQEDVVFSGPPDLETAAHEAAHVVQQRAGTQAAAPEGAHERRADEVAARVAAGRPVEALLAAPAGSKPPPLQLRRVKVETKELETGDLSRAEIYALVLRLSGTGQEADARAAQELLEALHEGDFDVSAGEDPDYVPSEGEYESDVEDWLGEEDREVPTEVYRRYGEQLAHPDPNKKQKRKRGRKPRGTTDISKLAQNTTAVSVFEQSGLPPLPPTAETEKAVDLAVVTETRTELIGQRSYPPMKPMAEESKFGLQTGTGTGLRNIHAEMIGLHTAMRGLVADHVHDRMLEIEPSNPVCFFCEVMLKLFNVRYREEFVSKKLFSKWRDPTGLIEAPDASRKRVKGSEGEKKEKRRFFTPRQMLELYGDDVEDATERALPLFADVENAEAFIQRILDGGLQRQRDLTKLIHELKQGSAILAAANERGRKKKGGYDKEAEAEPELEESPEGAEDPPSIEGVGQLRDVGSRNNNCLIEALLTAVGVANAEEWIDPIRAHLVDQGVAGPGNMLDLAGLDGAIVLSYLHQHHLLDANRGLVVHFWARPLELGEVVVVAGANPLHLWLSNNHFQAIVGE